MLFTGCAFRTSRSSATGARRSVRVADTRLVRPARPESPGCWCGPGTRRLGSADGTVLRNSTGTAAAIAATNSVYDGRRAFRCQARNVREGARSAHSRSPPSPVRADGPRSSGHRLGRAALHRRLHCNERDRRTDTPVSLSLAGPVHCASDSRCARGGLRSPANTALIFIRIIVAQQRAQGAYSSALSRSQLGFRGRSCSTDLRGWSARWRSRRADRQVAPARCLAHLLDHRRMRIGCVHRLSG